MAMALAARGDFLATSAVAGAATALTGADLAEEEADLPGEDLVALVTDRGAVFALEGFLAEGGVLTGVWDTLPCREAVEVVVTAFLMGTTFLPAGELAGFLAAGFLTGAAFLAATTGFFTATVFLATGFLATAFFAATTGFFTATGFLATVFFTASLAACAVFLTGAFLAGALALVFNLALALALCWVDFTAYLLSAGPGKFKGNSPTAVIFYIFTNFFSQ